MKFLLKNEIFVKKIEIFVKKNEILVKKMKFLFHFSLSEIGFFMKF